MSKTDSAAEGTLFSRTTGLPPRLGKATEDCKTKLPFLVKADVMLRANACGVTESEWLRFVVMKELYGKEQVVSMQAERARAMFEMEPIAAPKSAA